MKLKKLLSLFLAVALVASLAACAVIPESNNDLSKPDNADDTGSYNELPDIVSLDKKMANYFDISLFDEENYSDIYLGKKFKFDITYNDKKLTVPTTLDKLAEKEFVIQQGSEYDKNSYIFAKETVTLKFNDANSAFTALFYNSSNSSVRLNKCNIAKIRLENNQNTKIIVHFNVNGIDNYSTVTDVITILGTPSHFYATTEDTYYFDYFLHKSDRRNKIRVFVDITNDCVTAVEVSYYK
ncbi:MAG: hypothetical protein J6A78_00565 [Clostridia bacterium]|nr:hypothetical protein [Clostridia bacterium]